VPQQEAEIRGLEALVRSDAADYKLQLPLLLLSASKLVTTNLMTEYVIQCLPRSTITKQFSVTQRTLHRPFISSSTID